MGKMIYSILGLAALIGPILYAINMSANHYAKSFWDFYPVLVCGALLAIVFFFAAGKNNQ